MRPCQIADEMLQAAIVREIQPGKLAWSSRASRSGGGDQPTSGAGRLESLQGDTRRLADVRVTGRALDAGLRIGRWVLRHCAVCESAVDAIDAKLPTFDPLGVVCPDLTGHDLLLRLHAAFSVLAFELPASGGPNCCCWSETAAMSSS